jgi:hypothetical protein
MTEKEKNKEAVGSREDWAIIPFDEAEDDARWEQLIEETDKLIEETEEMEAAHGKILMENKLSDIELKKEEIEDAPF